MSEVTVESLPEEVALEVFKWLDTKSLKNVVLTCKEWADYVRRSHQWTLILADPFCLEEAKALLESVWMANRKYNKMVIKAWMGTISATLKFFEKHGASIHELTISCYYLTNASFWCKILNTMPDLKKVLFTSTSWDESINDVRDDELPSLCKLKTLKLDGGSTEVLKLFKKCQLHTLDIIGILFRDYSNQSIERLWNILAAQRDIKELKLDSVGCSALFEAPVTERWITFRLKKLSLSRPALGMSTNSVNNLTSFMKLHKNTLEDLELFETLHGNFCEFFLSLNHLKKLSLTVDDIPQERLIVNESVISLKLNFPGTAVGLRSAKSFISHLSNVQKLMLNGLCDYPFTKNIADNMKHLKDLDMNTVDFNTFDGARFPALKSLRIRQLVSPVNWDGIAKNNPEINELWIGNVDRPIYLDVAGITRALKLRKLTIESSQLKCNEKFFEVIRKNCSELKSLDLNEESLVVDISTVADIPGLRFCKF